MQQCIDQFIQCLYDASESQSRPLIPSSLRLLRSDIKARALSEETSHGENVVYTTTFVSLAPAVARTPRRRIFTSPFFPSQSHLFFFFFNRRKLGNDESKCDELQKVAKTEISLGIMATLAAIKDSSG